MDRTQHPKLSLKVDVDTLRGYLEGVPRLLDLFLRMNIRVSIFFSMGPDNSGKAIRRLFRKGFFEKMLRTRAPSTYGFKTLLYGTLLPAPLITQSSPAILRDALKDGHDCGTHAWDHVLWQDKLKQMLPGQIRDELDKARSLFTEITGTVPKSCAAPGWQACAASLEAQDKLQLNYASDTRGYTPFFPRCGEKVFRTLQIPTTLPTLDELLGAPGMNEKAIVALWTRSMRQEFNVLTIHAEMEGLSQLSFFERFLCQCLDDGVSFLALDEIASIVHERTIPVCTMQDGVLSGRAGTLATQQTEE